MLKQTESSEVEVKLAYRIDDFNPIRDNGVYDSNVLTPIVFPLPRAAIPLDVTVAQYQYVLGLMVCAPAAVDDDDKTFPVLGAPMHISNDATANVFL